MVSREDYNIYYGKYLADDFLENALDILDVRSINESTDVIQEDFKETINKYVNKVITGISNAWNKFRDNVSNQKLKFNDKDISDAIAKYDPKVQVQNYIEYDSEVMQNLNVKTLDYATMKADLKDKNTFFKKHNTSIFTDESKSFYDNLKAKSTKSTSDKHDITKDEITAMYAYMKNHKSFLDKVSKDLDNVNKAAKNVDYEVSKIQSTINDSAIMYEADEKENVVSSTDGGDTGGTNPAGGTTDQNNDKTKEITKGIQTYFQCTSDILSSEMKLSREIYKFYETVVMQHVSNTKESRKNDKKNETPTVNTTTNGTPQIDTSTGV